MGLTAGELDRLLTVADAHNARSAALVSLLVYNGLRIAEVLACDVESFTHQRGHRLLRIVRKGGKASTEPLSPVVLRALEAYIGERTTGPLFLNADGDRRLSYSITYKLIRRLARRAGIAAADKISPHSLRHSFATELLAADGEHERVEAVALATGHGEPRPHRGDLAGMDRDHRKALIDSALDRQAIGPLDRDQLDRERDQSRAQRADATLVVAIAAALDDPCWPSARASLRGALPVCAGTRED